ncbi:MAG: glycosyltransferase family 2 protein [Bacteroidetes bacterium]|nr:glycosyltransferase family 2 protein [Bacteroidota bacterium]
MSKIIYWTAIGLVVYTYAIYPCLLWCWCVLARKRKKSPELGKEKLPGITLLVAAYNEADCLAAKIQNALQIDYPEELLEIWIVTDGSTDNSPLIVREFPRVQLFHQPERLGKIQAIQRVIGSVQTELVVFSDANALLNKGSLRAIVMAFTDPLVGAVAGEKRVVDAQDAVTGESMYWKYESMVKKWEGGVYSVTGSAGEIFAIRKSLYQAVPANTLSDDLAISWQIIAQGYRMEYAADAYSSELGLVNIRQSFTRRIRVAAGSVQAALRIFSGKGYAWKPIFWWEVISHRILRTLVVPYLILLIGCLNLFLICNGVTYKILFAIQLYTYLATWFYWIKSSSQKQPVWISLPTFFILVHFAMIRGALSLWLGKQSVLWETYPRSMGKVFDVGKNE